MAHPNTVGHAEMYYAIVPSLLDALSEDKPQPVRNSETSIRFNSGNETQRLSFTPEGTLHAFTLAFSFKTSGTGTLASVVTSNNDTLSVFLDADGKLSYKSAKTVAAINDNMWHNVVLTHYHAWGRTLLYVDGNLAVGNNSISERFAPVKFHINDFVKAPQSIEFRELFLYRAGMCSEEISALNSQKMLKSSLELYVPLQGNAADGNVNLNNLAQSLNVVKLERSVGTDGLSHILNESKAKEITVFSISGVKMMHSSDFSTAINYQDTLPHGVYIAKILTDSGSVLSSKFIVRR